MAAYMLFHSRVVDREKMQEYLSKVMPTFEPYDPEVVVLEEDSAVLEGESPFPRTVVIRFDSREKALAWYNCAEYGEVRHLRQEATEGYALLCDGFSPGV